MWQPTESQSNTKQGRHRHGAKVHTVSVSRDQHLTWIRMLCRGNCSTDQSSSAYTLDLTYQDDPCGQLVQQSSWMKTCYDRFALHRYNLNTYIMPHTVIKSRYTNVKNHSEISRYFSVHVLPHPLRNSKELAKFYYFKLPWLMRGYENKQTNKQTKKTSSAFLAFVLVNRWILLTKGQWCGMCVHFMTSLCWNSILPNV